MSKLNITPKDTKDILNNFNEPNVINNQFLDNIPQTSVDPEVLNYFLSSNSDWEPFNFNFTLVTEHDILACIKSIKSNAVGVDQINHAAVHDDKRRLSCYV